jgi:hypothetical protein
VSPLEELRLPKEYVGLMLSLKRRMAITTLLTTLNLLLRGVCGASVAPASCGGWFSMMLRVLLANR